VVGYHFESAYLRFAFLRLFVQKLPKSLRKSLHQDLLAILRAPHQVIFEREKPVRIHSLPSVDQVLSPTQAWNLSRIYFHEQEQTDSPTRWSPQSLRSEKPNGPGGVKNSRLAIVDESALLFIGPDIDIGSLNPRVTCEIHGADNRCAEINSGVNGRRRRGYLQVWGAQINIQRIAEGRVRVIAASRSIQNDFKTGHWEAEVLI
jgi:hypothetical protein